MDNILTIRDLKVAFQVKSKLAYALDGINIDIPKGKIVGIVGESGCGKSMTAMSIMGLIKNPGKIVGGSIDFCGTELTNECKRLCKNQRQGYFYDLSGAYDITYSCGESRKAGNGSYYFA